jgi:uncharacterized protein
MNFTLAGQCLTLLPERALHWPQRQCLVLSDLHLGKSAHFRHVGIPVPEGELATDLARLSALVRNTRARHIIVVGDLFHAPAMKSPGLMAAFSQWRAGHPELHFTLIRGNHDKDRFFPEELELAVLDSWKLDSLHFVHDPAEAKPREKQATICGHLHPVCTLPGLAGRRLRSPVFYYRSSDSCFILPSFGSFTGGAEITPVQEDRVFAVTGAQVLEIPTALWRPRRRAR